MPTAIAKLHVDMDGTQSLFTLSEMHPNMMIENGYNNNSKKKETIIMHSFTYNACNSWNEKGDENVLCSNYLFQFRPESCPSMTAKVIAK